MNAHNKHEFLAYFDKFVQLPISMPLPYYEPKLFFKKCLYDIGFFSDKDKDNELLTENLLNKFIAIAEESVGNNPRALKRLFNTVSLVNLMRCVHITKCGTEGDIYNLLSHHPSGNKKLTFILICIQIVYPSVFYFLQKYPMFTRWSAELSIRIGSPLSTDDYKIVRALKTSDALNWDYAEWEIVLFCICKNDLFLRRRFTKILALLKEIELIFDCDDNRICSELSVALPWLSVTNINSDLIDF